jgi:hypothetical protein
MCAGPEPLPMIRTGIEAEKNAPRQLAQRILGELEVRDLIKHAKPGRDWLMLQVAYF